MSFVSVEGLQSEGVGICESLNHLSLNSAKKPLSVIHNGPKCWGNCMKYLHRFTGPWEQTGQQILYPETPNLRVVYSKRISLSLVAGTHWQRPCGQPLLTDPWGLGGLKERNKFISPDQNQQRSKGCGTCEQPSFRCLSCRRMRPRGGWC